MRAVSSPAAAGLFSLVQASEKPHALFRLWAYRAGCGVGFLEMVNICIKEIGFGGGGQGMCF